MKLYSGPLSLFTSKVRIALAEKALAYDRIEVPYSRENAYSPKHPEVLRINPKGQVPVLVDGALEIYDSTAILEYLEDAYPDPPLYPRDAAGRARCRQHELEADELLFPHVWTLIGQLFYGPADARDRDAIAGAYAGIGGQLRRAQAALGGRDWLCDVYSVADLSYAVFARTAGVLGYTLADDLGAVQAWLERVAARPAVRAEQDEQTAYAARLLSGAAA